MQFVFLHRYDFPLGTQTLREWLKRILYPTPKLRQLTQNSLEPKTRPLGPAPRPRPDRTPGPRPPPGQGEGGKGRGRARPGRPSAPLPRRAPATPAGRGLSPLRARRRAVAARTKWGSLKLPEAQAKGLGKGPHSSAHRERGLRGAAARRPPVGAERDGGGDWPERFPPGRPRTGGGVPPSTLGPGAAGHLPSARPHRAGQEALPRSGGNRTRARRSPLKVSNRFFNGSASHCFGDVGL
ncbi:uncharacterized protein LOC142055676 [Phalacrocorax aristotelis]|uniref:uncharacterized protein LOC142055676 n=1 Tax=Phalacrocorax aristotelis TaxID=126867 RepID=UPI003F4CA1A9